MLTSSFFFFIWGLIYAKTFPTSSFTVTCCVWGLTHIKIDCSSSHHMQMRTCRCWTEVTVTEEQWLCSCGRSFREWILRLQWGLSLNKPTLPIQTKKPKQAYYYTDEKILMLQELLHDFTKVEGYIVSAVEISVSLLPSTGYCAAMQTLL